MLRFSHSMALELNVLFRVLLYLDASSEQKETSYLQTTETTPKYLEEKSGLCVDAKYCTSQVFLLDGKRLIGKLATLTSFAFKVIASSELQTCGQSTFDIRP